MNDGVVDILEKVIVVFLERGTGMFALLFLAKKLHNVLAFSTLPLTIHRGD